MAAEIVCKVCKETPLNKAGICVGCCDRLANVPMPEVTRPPRGCRSCNGMQFVRVIPREYTATGSGDYVAELVAPMYLTHRIRDGESNIRRGAGMLEAWVCAACDYVEWYCHTASKIPIGPEFMTEVVDFTPDSPYR